MTTTAHARRNDPDMSWIAARRVNATKGEAEVLRVACEFSGEFRWEDVWERIKLYRPNASDSGVRGRIKGLMRKGLIRVAGEVKNERGNPTRTFEIVPIQQQFFGG